MEAAAATDLWAATGQTRAAEALRAAVAGGEMAHAWAFTGPAGVGQEQAGRALAAALNCPRTTSGRPCGACDVCSRCARGAYPALWEFAPAGREHRVDDVRGQWLRAASRSAVEGDWKVLRIAEADRMNEAAANAFLKGLEEPPARTVWVLDVADPDELPDTILSRCRPVRFVPWGPDELDVQARRLGLADDRDRALAVRAALGLPARLTRFAAEGGLDDLRTHREILGGLRERGPGYALLAARAIDEEVKRRTTALKTESKAERAALAELYGEQLPRGVVRQLDERVARQEREARTAVVQAALDDLLARLRDAVLVAAGWDPATAVHADAPDGLRADADALGLPGLLRACDLVAATREHLELNVQQGLALEALFLDLSAIVLENARG
ncbi:MAG TPA: hypothetical protein VM324_11720 [Egibacteraceae bacterium]|nr:hypothetical protein [Egibacteraceae bacterium]